MLKRRGAVELGLTSGELSVMDLEERFRVVLEAYAGLLREYGKDIISDSLSALSV
jgi:hypothetical protein